MLEEIRVSTEYQLQVTDNLYLVVNKQNSTSMTTMTRMKAVYHLSNRKYFIRSMTK